MHRLNKLKIANSSSRRKYTCSIKSYNNIPVYAYSYPSLIKQCLHSETESMCSNCSPVKSLLMPCNSLLSALHLLQLYIDAPCMSKGQATPGTHIASSLYHQPPSLVPLDSAIMIMINAVRCSEIWLFDEDSPYV